jgi:hypothetical protein
MPDPRRVDLIDSVKIEPSAGQAHYAAGMREA